MVLTLFKHGFRRSSLLNGKKSSIFFTPRRSNSDCHINPTNTLFKYLVPETDHYHNVSGDDGIEASNRDGGTNLERPRANTKRSAYSGSEGDLRQELDRVEGDQETEPGSAHIQPSRNQAFFNTNTALGGLQNDNNFLSPWMESQELRPSAWSESIAQAQRKITALLEEEEDQDLLENIWHVVRIDGVAGSLRSTTFIEILRRLDPEDEFLPLRHGYISRIPKHYKWLGARVNAYLDLMFRRRAMYVDICQNRISSGKDMNVREYAQLLKCARGTYDARTASTVMRTMLLKDVRPDLACYKYFFEAKCWSDAWHPFERQLLRVFPRNLRKRLSNVTEIRLSENRSIHPYVVGSQGLKRDVTEHFTHMIDSGILADSEVFGHLITALAREGDIEGVKAVLRGAWNVDVEDLEISAGFDQKVPPDSPLHPDQNTLFIIAHAFGINNDVSTALRTVDCVAQKYSITIPLNVWNELLEWSYVLSTPRSEKEKLDGWDLGKVPKRTTENLWNLCVGEPYHCKPTLPMYDILIRSEMRRDNMQLTFRYMHEAMSMLYAEQQQHDGDDNREQQIQSAGRSKIAEEQQADRFLGFAYVQRWFLKLLKQRRFVGSENEPARRFWQREILPDIVGILWRYRHPGRIEYSMGTGSVRLKDLDEDSKDREYASQALVVN